MRIPNEIGQAGRKWIRALGKDVGMDKAALETVFLAAACLDRINSAQREIAAKGVTVTDRFGTIKTNPAHKVEIDNKSMFERYLRALTTLGVLKPVKVFDQLAAAGFPGI